MAIIINILIRKWLKNNSYNTETIVKKLIVITRTLVNMKITELVTIAIIRTRVSITEIMIILLMNVLVAIPVVATWIMMIYRRNIIKKTWLVKFFPTSNVPN